MAFKWVNPGYGWAFDRSGTSTLTSYNYNPKSGVYINSSARVNINPGNEYWAKAYLYSNYSGGTGFYLWFNPSTENAICLHISSYDTKAEFVYGTGRTLLAEHINLDIERKAIGDVVFHARTDTKDGLLEAFLNGKCILKYTGNVANSAIISVFGTGVDSTSDACLSNFIVADYDISNEEIAIVPLKDITGTWEGISDGKAKATEAGQTLSHKIDSTKLKEFMNKYSTDPTITSITVGAKGIQYDSDKVNKLKVDITNGTTSLLSESLTIASGNTLPLRNVIKNISTDNLDNITFTLTSEKV